jgi:hypothetical protein
MRFSLSETKSFGPFSVTASKTGLTFSIGIPGFRVAINTKGEVRTRVGAKGFSWQKSKKVFDGVDPSKLLSD